MNTIETLYQRERDALIRRDYAEAREIAERRIQLAEARAKPPVQPVSKPKVVAIPERLHQKWSEAYRARMYGETA